MEGERGERRERREEKKRKEEGREEVVPGPISVTQLLAVVHPCTDLNVLFNIEIYK